MNRLIALEQFSGELIRSECIGGEFDFESHKRIIFWGVRSLGHGSEETYGASDAEERLFIYQFLTDLMDQITPRQLMSIFPINKEYDGDKYEMKDYFYTIKKCKNHGLDKPLENSFNFLWDYYNRDTGAFIVNYLSTLSDVSRKMGGQGLMETYLAEIGQSTYSEKTIKGKKVLVENLTFNSKGKLV